MSTQFYKRQKQLSEVGDSGQEKLKNSQVAIVGAGGLGHPVASYLAASGVGKIALIDFDIVDESNLHRQVLFNPGDIGRNKSVVLSERIKAQNPYILVYPLVEKISRNNIHELLSDYPIVLDCTDNFKAQFLLHDYCYYLKKDLISANLYQFEGEIKLFKNSQRKEIHGTCLRCLWPTQPGETCVKNCAESGILGSVAGVLGSLQATETLKLILEMPGISHGESLLVDVRDMEMTKMSWPCDSSCPLCSAPGEFEIGANDQTHDREISYFDISDQYELIDIREEEEVLSMPIPIKWNATHIPQSQIEHNKLLDKKYLFVCRSGVRSLSLVNELRAIGVHQTFSLKMGMARLFD
jgi:sulfur-carrier protein adenylyltransferase/sulfurtransferase